VLVNKTESRSKLTLQDFAKITKIAEAELEYDIKECSALTGEGVMSARDWLVGHRKQKASDGPANAHPYTLFMNESASIMLFVMS
jgi:hypothetical protein